MTRIADNARDCISGIEARVKRDLDELLETNTTVSFYASEEEGEALSFVNYTDLGDIVNLDEIDFTAFKSDASQLESYKAKKVNLAWPELRLKSNLLRSNCRVTNQPDWGDVYIKIKGENLPTADSLAKYIVSHRTVSHFHEEICEMVYKHLTDAYQPEELMVACLYTRRGGLDINPVRASHNMLIPAMFEEKEFRLAKTLRQ